MPTDIEAIRLAAAISCLRPDWPAASIKTLVMTKHATRPLQDVAVALAWVAADPGTRTPARINESGPWWPAPANGRPITAMDRRMCGQCGMLHYLDEGCPPRPKPAFRRADPDTVAAHVVAMRASIRDARAALAGGTG